MGGLRCDVHGYIYTLRIIVSSINLHALDIIDEQRFSNEILAQYGYRECKMQHQTSVYHCQWYETMVNNAFLTFSFVFFRLYL